jgi:Tol biopolymer transport system component
MPRFWSRDGEWIYFISRRSADYELWKIPPDGQDNEAVQVTKNGAIGAQESTDGKFLYYTKWRIEGIWRMSTEGGDEEQVLKDGGWGEFGLAVVEEGIYYQRRESEFKRSINFLDFETGMSVRITEETLKPACPTLSPDGRFLLYAQRDHEGADIMLVENFR